MELRRLHVQFIGESLPRDDITIPNFPSLPSDTVPSLSEFIEYSNEGDIILVEDLLSGMQVQSARILSLVSELEARADGDHVHVLSVSNIEEYIIGTGKIYARASAAFGYARREESELPKEISWDQVRSGLWLMGLDSDDFPRLYETIKRREQRSSKP